MCNNKCDNSCFVKVLEKILCLQQTTKCLEDEGCSKPFLGPSCTTLNTRPINLYSCCTGNLWEMPCSETNSSTSSVFRIENLNDNCATFRILVPNYDRSFSATNQFFTINLNCVGAIKCLSDTCVSNL